MKIRFGFVSAVLVGLAGLGTASASAQILISSGNYTQNFDSLATSGTSNPWIDNSTLVGWYSSRNGTNTANYRAGDGNSNAGDLWSYGVTGVSNLNDRALGSVASGPASPVAFGLRFTNDTATAFTNLAITYTGEQWRCGGNTSPQTLSFSYQVSNTPLTNAALGTGWVNFSALDFTSPTALAAAGPLDGNAATNQQAFANILLTGAVVAPGQELFLRWVDINDTGNDHGFGVDDLTVFFNGGVSNPPAAPQIITQPQSQSATIGDNVTFTVAATGHPAPAYQWRLSNTNLPGATSATLSLPSVTTNHAGNYYVVITNSAGGTNSQTVTLTVDLPLPTVPGFTLMNYNTHGNFIGDWTTNSLQIQAIGRQVQYLNPDIMTFQEIPMTNSGWTHMIEFVAVYRPGFYLAINSGTDGFIRSAIISRFPITRSTSWLDGASLTNFGYDGRFTRDLFEAQVAVPGFPQPLHVFTTHLKSGTSASADAQRRAAEANAISNFIAHAYLTTNSLHPYLLTGDLNEDIARPATGSQQPIQRLTNNTGLVLTTPVNPYSDSELTFSIQAASLTRRYDYILPCELLHANIASSQVFRTDLLPNPPPPLLADDATTASDHLPVFMAFNHPYDKAFKLLAITRSNLTVTLNWQSVLGQPYRVESSTNLTTWITLASNLTATGTNHTFSTNLNDTTRFFRVSRGP